MWKNLLLMTLSATLCLNVNAYPMYQGYIPNGANVPNPCNKSTIWPGVGHKNVYGTGDRNPFGLDFAANNHVWNSTLCRKDSDGDGRTNGQELGDPNCTWTIGSAYPMPSTSHPGVCEPLDSPMCAAMNSWLMNCSPTKLNCPAINATGVLNYTMRFPVSPVPGKETTYICHQFALPNDTVADIIAIEPVIDNAPILHHMLLYACTSQPMDHQLSDSFECGMGSGPSCRALIGIWGVGVAGQCLNSQLGFRIGPGGFQYAILQLHWNNPQLYTNLTDSSGMRIYYTTQLRPNRGQVIFAGQIGLVIPPMQAEVTATGNCSSLCTQHLPNSIFLTSAILHMHKLGKSGDVRLSRNGMLLQVLDNVTHYDYNSPTLHEFDTPIEMKPGDEIQVKCVYDSSQKNITTYYGEATSDEMCLGFFAYYPLVQDVGFCGQFRSIDVCSSQFNSEFGSCDYQTFLKLLYVLPAMCSDGCTTTSCALMLNGIQATGCLNYPDVMAFVNAFMSTLGSVFAQCSMERPPSTSQPTVGSSFGSSSTAQSSGNTTAGQNPQCTQQPTGICGMLCTSASGQALANYFGLVITLVFYAIHV